MCFVLFHQRPEINETKFDIPNQWLSFVSQIVTQQRTGWTQDDWLQETQDTFAFILAQFLLLLIIISTVQQTSENPPVNIEWVSFNRIMQWEKTVLGKSGPALNEVSFSKISVLFMVPLLLIPPVKGSWWNACFIYVYNSFNWVQFKLFSFNRGILN